MKRYKAYPLGLWAALATVLLVMVWLYQRHSVPSGKPAASPAYPHPMAVLPSAMNAYPVDGPLWYSNRQILCFLPSLPGQDAGRQATLVDTVTGKKKYLTDFNAKWGDDFSFASQSVQLSPNGRWLLWSGNKRLTTGLTKPIWELAALDGSSAWEWPRDARVSYPKIAWSRDSRHWAEADTGYEIGGQTRLLFYTLGYAQIKQFPLPASTFDICTGLWFNPSGHVIVTNAAGGAGGEGNMSNGFYEFALPDTNFPVQKYVIPILPMATVEGCVLSPDGTHLAWRLYIVHLIPRRNTLPGIIARLSGEETRYARSVWVSLLDGSNMHQVTPDAESDSPRYIQWTPDGKRVSFWQKDSLWTVPAN